MQTQNEKESFHYTYSAAEQDEVKKIRQKYEPQEETKMEKLRRLDAQVTKKPTMVSIILGVLGALIMGTGMSIAMTEFGNQIGLEGVWGMTVGIFIGILGIVLVCLAYPVYNHLIKKEREKIAPEILKLTEELMQ